MELYLKRYGRSKSESKSVFKINQKKKRFGRDTLLSTEDVLGEKGAFAKDTAAAPGSLAGGARAVRFISLLPRALGQRQGRASTAIAGA